MGKTECQHRLKEIKEMKTRTIKEISHDFLKELDPSFWGSITLRIQQGELINIVKEQSIKIDALAQDVQP